MNSNNNYYIILIYNNYSNIILLTIFMLYMNFSIHSDYLLHNIIIIP